MIPLLLAASCAWSAKTEVEDDEAQRIYKTNKDRIFQIRVIELSSGNKTAIGSGFLITAEGEIATNYHVVSHFVHNPDRYRLEYLTESGNQGSLQLMDIDVIHDLAIVKSNIINQKPLTLARKSLEKGAGIYSLGNPHDLGFSLVEGTYNGLLEKSLYNKIFISGSLNPGMSGGPTLNHDGEVIGINVSTAGNQLSFLVPVKFLIDLAQNLAVPDENDNDFFYRRIEQQILEHQSNVITELIEKNWETSNLGPFTLPGAIADIFKCWGDSDDNTEALMEHAYSNCHSEDQIFLSQRFTTGSLAFLYDYYKTSQIGPLHFYNLYQVEYIQGTRIRVNSATKEHVGNFECNVDFVNFTSKDWKIAVCARNYIKFPSLYDVTLSLALVSDNDQGLLIQFAISGVEKLLAMELVNKFIQHIRWNNPNAKVDSTGGN